MAHRSSAQYPRHSLVHNYWLPWLSKYKGISGNAHCCFACGLVPFGSSKDEDSYKEKLDQWAERGRIGELSISWLEANWIGSVYTSLQRSHIIPAVKFGPATVQNLWNLCHNCHKESEVLLLLSEKVRWLLRMGRDIRIYHDHIRKGGLPTLVAYVEERGASEAASEGLTDLQVQEAIKKVFDLTMPKPPEFDSLHPPTIEPAMEEALALHNKREVDNT